MKKIKIKRIRIKLKTSINDKKKKRTCRIFYHVFLHKKSLNVNQNL